MYRLAIALLIGGSIAGCNWTTPKNPGAAEASAKEKLANTRRLKRACGSAETYARLKAFAFDEATKIQRTPSDLLDRIAANVTIRMENPVAKSRDEALNVTVCTGHLIVDLPPGIDDAFDGDRRLEADVEYSAQEAVDGSGLVYQMQGAEPIIYRLAALTMASPTAGARAAIAEVPPATGTANVLAPVAPPSDVVASRPLPPPAPPAPPPPRPTTRPAMRPTPQPAKPAVRQVAEQQPRGATRPSFNCRSARSRVERMVCSNSALAAQDRRMSAVFYAELARGDRTTQRALRASRDRFLSYRDRCSDAGCVSQAYDDRIAEIRDIAGG